MADDEIVHREDEFRKCVWNCVSDLDLEVEVERTYNAAVRVLGCMDARVNAVGRDLRNNQFNRQYGYLVEDGAQGTRAHVMAGRNRHAYTTSQPSIVANSEELENYGPAYGALITGQQHGDTQAGFDTHHGSENITFAKSSPLVQHTQLLA